MVSGDGYNKYVAPNLINNFKLDWCWLFPLIHYHQDSLIEYKIVYGQEIFT